MTEILSKLFVKDYKNYTNQGVRKAYGTMSSVVGIVVNIILAIMKLFVGIVVSSIAVTADAFNNLSDAGASVITLISFHLSSKPADKEHPFGHARFEYISSMIVSFIILLVGFELFVSSGELLLGFNKAVPKSFDLVATVILVISIVMKLWLGLFYRKIGKKINSKIITATSQDSLTDSISTGATLISAVLVSITGIAAFDAIVGLCVSVVIIIAGAKILNETKDALLGEAPVKDVVDDICSIVDSYPDIIGVHDLLVHNYGPGKFVASLHAEVDGSKNIYELHDMIDNAEREIKERLDIACTIHMDPVVMNDETVNQLKKMVTEVIHSCGFNYQIHDFRVVIGTTHTNLIFDVVIPFEEKIKAADIIDKISSEIIKKAPNHYCVITIDRE